MVLWTCQICFAHEDEPFQYRCNDCLTTYRPHQIEKDDPANLGAHQEQSRRLRQKVQTIGQRFHSGNKFHDTTFPRHYYAEKIRRWCRPRALYLCTDPYRKVPWYIHDEPDYTDIEQCVLGHCWFVACLSSVATKHHFVQQLVVSGDKRAGVYGVTLFVNGNWHYIIVDDKLPCKDKYFNPATIEVRAKQLWPYLAEKALAKVFGSYVKLEGGRFTLGMTHLTGCAPQMLCPSKFAMPTAWRTTQMSEKQLFEHLERQLLQGFPSTLSFFPTDEQIGKNLESQHAYQLLAVQDCGKDCLLVKLRNPWGHSPWLGSWNQRDYTNWSSLPEDLRKLRAEAPNHMGIFWMHIEEILESIDCIDTCLIQDNWYENACNGRLCDQEQNQIYTHKLIIAQPTMIDLFLWTKDMQTTWESCTDVNVHILVQKRVGNQMSTESSTTFSQSCFEHSLTNNFQPGIYYVYIFCDRILKFIEGALYTMRSLSDKKVVFQTKSEPADNLAELIIQLAIARGKRYERENQDGEIYILEHQVASFDAIMVINTSPDRYLNVMTKCEYGEEFDAGRGGKFTEDFLPPSTIQVVNTLVTTMKHVYEPQVSSRYLPVDSDIAECYPPLTPQTSPVHHLVDLNEFTAKQID